MKCNHCGNPLTHDAKFCTACGKPVGSESAHHIAPPPLPHSAIETTPGLPDDWSSFFHSLGSEVLQVSSLSPARFVFQGERKVKALLSRTTLRYEALAILDPSASLLQWWEKLSESSFGVAPENAGFSSESRRQKGTSVEVKKSVQTPGGAYTYHYGDLRAVVEAEAQRRGWEFELLVKKP